MAGGYSVAKVWRVIVRETKLLVTSFIEYAKMVEL